MLKRIIKITYFEKIFIGFPLSPNTITFLSLIAASLGLVMLLLNNLPISLILFFFAFLLDGIDGIVARANKKATSKGAFLDGVIDRIVEGELLFGLLFVDMRELFFPNFVWVFLFLFFGTCLTSYVIAYADHRGLKPKGKIPGLYERAERAVTLLLVLFLLMVLPETYYAALLLSIGSLLSFITFSQRVLWICDPLLA